MSKTLTTLALIFMLTVPALSGCVPLMVGAAAGAGAAAWINGDLEVNFDAPVSTVHSAAIRGLRKLELPITSEDKDKHHARIRSKYSDGKDVTIDITAITERTSKVKIRVGVFGDQARSEAILTSMKKYL